MKPSVQNWHFEKIIDYFEGKLTVEEQEAIDRLITENTDFAEWLDTLYGDWQEDPEHYRGKVQQFRKDFFEQLEHLRPTPAKEIQTKSPWLPLHKKTAWAMAATVAIVIIAFLLISILPPEDPPCQLTDVPCIVENSGGHYPEKIILADDSPTKKEIIAVANAYKEERFKAVIEQAPPLLNDSLAAPYHAALSLYLGISYLSDGDPESAISTLRPLSREDSEPGRAASFYLALAYLSQNDLEAARPFLIQVAASNHFYQVGAKGLLRRIPSQ